MRKTLFLLAVGLAVGYYFGFADARQHDEDVVHRLVARAGGSSRQHMPNDIDKTMERLEKK